MIRFVGYRQDSIDRRIIFESTKDTNWARAVSANSGQSAGFPVFFLVDFEDSTATITDTETGSSNTVSIDSDPVYLDYLSTVLKEMDAELVDVINTHGATPAA